MREILFRGKHTWDDRKNWVYGSLIQTEDFCGILDTRYENDMDYPYLDGDLGIIDGHVNPVIPETVSQYIGLIDKRGNKIFEGDILESPVKPISTKFGTRVLVTDICERRFMALYANEYEVVGNMWDNPEMMKES